MSNHAVGPVHDMASPHDVVSMHDVVRAVADGEQWDRIVLARAVALRGIGARREGEVLAVGPPGLRVGDLLGGMLDQRLLAAAGALPPGEAGRLVVLEVGDADAVAAGLACGGQASILLQRAAALPAAAVQRLKRGEPLLLATDLGTGRPAVLDPPGTPPASAGSDAQQRGLALSRLVRSGRSGAAIIEDTVYEAFVPTPRLLLVGPGVLATAIAAQAALLGWEAATAAGADEAVAVLPALGPAAGVVVLAHEPAVDDPVLLAALGSGVRYLGALGSRRTQADRWERLRAAGVPEEQLGQVHGPVGLDLGARTPEETALAVCAEMLAVLSGRVPAALRDVDAPIHRPAEPTAP